jgi:hypothetical protein
MPKAARGAIALCLLLLAASPFTAPFSTFEFDQHHFTATVDAAKVAAHKDLSCWIPNLAVAGACAAAAVTDPHPILDLRPRPLPLRAILRI